MKIGRHAATVGGAIVLSLLAPRIYAQTRIAVVDLQRAITETEDGRRAKTRLKRLVQQRQKTLEATRDRAKALQEEYERLHKVWSREVRAEKEAALAKAGIELRTQ